MHLANGLPSFTLVGLADIEVKEARDDWKNRFFIDFTVNFCSLRENPVFQNYQEQYERHRAV